MKKSQVSTEFLFFVGIAMVILMIYLFISSNYFDIIARRKDNIAAQNLLEQTRNEINLAARVENGYTRTITLPENINGEAYEIDILNREIYIIFKGNSYSKLLATDVNVNGVLAPGKDLTITKLNNEVEVKA
ncbi:MAG: hypothetical protein AABX55_03055 [Nanoarchaeota archaeon]